MMIRYEKQSGSTMVEMLGYLAIFALLAAGIYAGYGAASRRIKVDRTVNAVNDVIQDIRTGFGAKRFYSILGSGTTDFVDSLIQNDIVSYKLCVNLNCGTEVPSSCTCNDKVDNVAVLTHPLGGKMKITLADPVSGVTNAYRKFVVELLDITRVTCFPLASQNWNGSGETVNVIESLAIDGKPESNDEKKPAGFTKFPLNLSDVSDYCNTKTESGTHVLTFTVR